MAAKAAHVRSNVNAGWRYAYPAYVLGHTHGIYHLFTDENDQLKEPMFFGQPVNVARYDQQKYDIFEKLIEKQLSFFWRPEEVDVSRDRIDYQSLPDHENISSSAT